MEKLLFTGATGFLGQNVMPLLKERYEVSSCGLEPQNDIVANLAMSAPELPRRYDVVLHACGKAHVVPRTPQETQAFYDVNYQGTVNLCAALEKAGVPKALIFISTVAVYGCESGENISEEHPRNGSTPYAKSKIMAEDYLVEWCAKNGVTLGILRPSLIAGPNPPGNLGAMINGIKTGRYFDIAHGSAHKSVLMAEDIARLVPLLAQNGGTYNVCDDAQPTFGQLSRLIAFQLGNPSPKSLPMWAAKSAAKVGDLMGAKAPINTLKLKKITETLTFSNEKAKHELGWIPTPVLENFKI